ncbi:MAG: hypothetical protein QM708_10435 [Propioniciclava sp.]|uniref:DUF6541 family protein n=1 Tax=Propioniciclava sp. TaxID=2038686 RepID=UPI0039E71836
MSWLAFAGPLLFAVALVLLPGLAIALAAGRRGFGAAALAPALSFTAISVGAIAGAAAGIPWGWWTPLATAAVLSGLAWALRRALARWLPPAETRTPLREQWPWWAAAAVAMVLWLRHLRNVFDRPDAFSQTFDNIYHLSLTRFMAASHNGSSLAAGGLEGPGVHTFYPAAFHDLASLVLLAFPGSITVALTAAVWAIVAVAWPLGALFLVRTLAPTGPAAALGAGVLAASFTGFPLLLIKFGVLYPNLTGLTLLPAAVGLTVEALGLGREARYDPRALLLGGLALPGLFLSHPSAVLSLFAIATPMLLVQIVRETRALVAKQVAPAAGWLRIVLMVACLPVFGYAWQVGRPDDLPWPPRMPRTDAFGQALLNAPLGWGPAWVVSLLVALGIVAAWQRRQAWLVASWAVTLVLWLVAASGPEGDLRDLLTGGYYNDPFRLAALLTVAAFPLAAVGLEAVTGWLAGRFTAASAGTSATATVVAGVLVVATVAGTTQRTRYLDEAVDETSSTYALTADAPLISTDEYALIQRVPSHVEPGAVVAANPWNGSSLLYAFTGVPTTTKHIFYASGPELDLLNLALDDAATDPAVCPAARALGVRYALDFGDREVHGAHHPFPGLEDLAVNPGVTEVDREGEAVLYRIDVC